MNVRFRWYVAVCLLALAVAAGCGRKTNPLIPDSPRPEAIHVINAVSRGGTVYLTWQMPTKNVEGKNIDPSGIRKILIDRAELVQDHRKARFKRAAELDVADLPPSRLRNNTATWTDEQVRYGESYAYRLRTVGAHGVSPWSEPVQIVPQASLAAPKGLTAAKGDSNIRLTWEAVSTELDGAPAGGFIGYNVYRGTEKGIHAEAPLNKEPITATSYKDATAVNDQTYYYVVRAVDGPPPAGRESPDSEEVSATPKDLTPPARPKGLTVVGGVDRVFLTWNENHEADLAGYHVYRSTRSGRGYGRLTEKPLARTTFSDEGVKGGTVYYYVVTAVDKSGNESGRSEEKHATVGKLR